MAEPVLPGCRDKGRDGEQGNALQSVTKRKIIRTYRQRVWPDSAPRVVRLLDAVS